MVFWNVIRIQKVLLGLNECNFVQLVFYLVGLGFLGAILALVKHLQKESECLLRLGACAAEILLQAEHLMRSLLRGPKLDLDPHPVLRFLIPSKVHEI